MDTNTLEPTETAQADEPATPPPDRGSGFFPILVRQLAGIIATHTAALREPDRPTTADLIAIKELQVIWPADSISPDLTKKLIDWERNIRLMNPGDLPYMAVHAFAILAALDNEFLGLTSDAGTHP
jgi:hypothetical protein